MDDRNRSRRRERLQIAGVVTAACLTAGLIGAGPAVAAPTLLVNGGFEAGTSGWTFTGGGVASNRPHGGTKLAYLDEGAANSAMQTIEVAEDGLYATKGWFSASKTGAVLGLRDENGTVLASTAVAAGQAYTEYALDAVPLEEGDAVTVFVTGGTGWVNFDDLDFFADDRSLLALSVQGQQGETVYDTGARTVSFQMPYESDVTALTPVFELAEGATISPDPTQGIDFTAPVVFTVTTASGAAVDWTVGVTSEGKSVTIDSPDAGLNDAFNWSKWRAREHVQTGKSGPINVNGGTPGPEIVDYIPSYWAGYAHRTAFYSRDFVHQASGGHLLGLEEENKTMLKAFAATANESRKWYPLWALNFDGSPYTIDYKSDSNFVREVPAVFELVEEAAQLYRWTGDADYLDDPVLWQYYTKAVTDFIALHDSRIPNGVAEGTGHGIFSGAASYDERPGIELIESGDGISSQYAAFLAYASLAAAKGDQATAAEFTAKADDLQTYFNTEWGIDDGQWEYIRGRDGDGDPVLGFGREPSGFEAIKSIIDPDAKRTYDFLPYLNRMYDEDRAPNIESLTYAPDALFNYGHDAEAFAWMQDIVSHLHEPHQVRQQGLNGDYPETSYTLVSQTVEGLAGVVPDAAADAIAVRSHLPAALPWLDLDHVVVGEHDFGVRHDGRTKSTVTHNAGDQALNVTFEFPGAFKRAFVNGKKATPVLSHDNGRAISSVTVSVPVGATFEVAVDQELNTKKFGDTILTHPGDFALTGPSDAAPGVSTKNAKFSWTKSDNAKEYRVVVARDAELSDVVGERIVSGASTKIAALPDGVTLYWQVTAINPHTGQSLVVPGGVRSFRTAPDDAPAAPAELGAYRSGDLVALAWTSDETALTATISRAPVGSDAFSVIARDVTGDGFVDRGAAGGPWKYRVTSGNERGEGPQAGADEQPVPTDGPIAYLSDRAAVSASTGWGALGRDASASGGAIVVGGTEYDKGLGVHAPSEVVYNILPADASFHAVVGADGATAGVGSTSIQFVVLVDEEVVFDSGTMRSGTAPKSVDIDVLGANRLVLRVTDTGNGNSGDHADWADARMSQLR